MNYKLLSLLLISLCPFFSIGYSDETPECPCDPCENTFFYTCGDDLSAVSISKLFVGKELDNYNVLFGTKGFETKKLKFWGLIQTDYVYKRFDDRDLFHKDVAEKSNFIMPNVRLAAHADLGNCWHGIISLDLAYLTCTSCYSKTCSLESDTSNHIFFYSLDRAYIEKIYAGHSFKAGYRKVNFGAEEHIEPENLKTTERSVATVYFNGFRHKLELPNDRASLTANSRVAIGNRHVGLFIDGEYGNIGYGGAITNSFPGLGSSSTFANDIGLYGNIYYTDVYKNICFELGVNLGYQSEGNTNWLTSAAKVFSNDIRSNIIAWNPYATVSWNGITLLGEFLGARIERGAMNSSEKNDNYSYPLGYNLVVTYAINDCLEAVFRYSNIDTDQRGIRPYHVLSCCATDNPQCITSACSINNDCVSDVLNVCDSLNSRCCNFDSTYSGSGANIFNEVDSIYFGLNYYALNKAFRLSLGYEHRDYHGRWDGLNFSGAFPVPFATFGSDKLKTDSFHSRVQIYF